jgi:hypothetical protein
MSVQLVFESMGGGAPCVTYITGTVNNFGLAYTWLLAIMCEFK